jgi:hypothetical protein
MFLCEHCLEIWAIYKLFVPMSLKIPDVFQAQLHDIITSSKVVNCNEPVEFPWMVDGAGVPKNAAQLLTKLVQSLDRRSI